MALTLTKKVLILVAIPVLFELALVAFLLPLIGQVQDARAKAARGRELSGHVTALLTTHIRRSMLLMARKLTSGAAISAQEAILVKKAVNEVNQLSALSKESDEQARWEKIVKLGQLTNDELNSAERSYGAGENLKAAASWSAAQSHFNSMLELCEYLTNEQNHLQRENQEYFEKYDHQLKIILELSVLASVLIAAISTTVFMHSTHKRLQQLMSNTQRLAAGQAPIEHVAGRDELARIDGIFHQMYGDLSELRKKERAILDNAAEVICSIDEGMSITDINDAVFKLWGYKADDLLGKRLLELVADEDKSDLSSNLAKAIASKSETRFETKILTQGGSKSDTAWSATWSDAQRSLYCVVADITERKQLERMKQDFIAMVSHDLRTPLTSVLACMEVVGHSASMVDKENRMLLDRASRNLQVSLSLINQLLEIEKMDSGQLTINLDAVSTREIILKACDAVADLSNARNIAITVPTTNYELIADSERLSQVLVNLLGNALKFADANTAIVIAEEQTETYTKLSVSDKGRGIALSDQARIFERFQQVNASGQVERMGSGLGLSICKAIVEAHGGEIGVTSVPGQGSTFWFKIDNEPGQSAKLTGPGVPGQAANQV